MGGGRKEIFMGKEEITEPDFGSLNNEQKEAVRTTDGPVLILAGAGTGKTHTLTARVSYILRQGIPGDSILLVTFTNKAASQ